MLIKIKSLIFAAALTLTFAIPALVPAVTYAAGCNDIQTAVTSGANAATGSGAACGSSQDTNFQSIAKNVVNIFSMIVGVVAVIMIIYGGFKYITSGGDSGNVSAAKNTLIYAIIGLIIVALSQFIVHFVLTGTTNAVVSQ